MRSLIRPACTTTLAIATALAGCCAAAADLTVRLDARDLARRKVHADLTIAAKPGPLTLVFARWMPGEHGPTGPLEVMIGLEIRANGQRLGWVRDPFDMYAFKLDVPAGADSVTVAMDTALPTESGAFSAGPSSTEQLAVLSWNEVVLLPKGADAEKTSAVATLLAPAGWAVASNLAYTPAPDGSVQFEETSLARLIDSPVQVGRFMKLVEVPGSAPRPDIRHSISMASDSAAALEVPDDFARGYGRMVAEAGALFGSRMYRHYTWLLTLSDHVAHFGLEHHESSDDRREENALGEADLRSSVAGLLSHEYVHSWNAKYRRPEGLLSPDYQRPMDGTLLWVYEGLTEYWGDVLTARAGLMKVEDCREGIARTAGIFDVQPGARWRPLADTATSAQVLYGAPVNWEAGRRGTDFYEAATFLWLDVDAQMRAQSRGRASLDDFARRFFAGDSGAPALKPYVEQDVYDALAAVVPGDWRAFIRRHLDVADTTALLGALERSGWKLVYLPEKNAVVELAQQGGKYADRRWSIGLMLGEDGVVADIIDDRAAGRAGFGPGMTITAVNGRRYSIEALDAAIVDAQKTRKPIELLVENAEYFRTIPVAYYDGPRYPHLQRIEGRADLLGQVLASRVR